MVFTGGKGGGGINRTTAEKKKLQIKYIRKDSSKASGEIFTFCYMVFTGGKGGGRGG